MSPIGLIDVSSLIRNPERMPLANTGAANAAGALGGGVEGVDPTAFTDALSTAISKTGPADAAAMTGAANAIVGGNGLGGAAEAGGAGGAGGAGLTNPVEAGAKSFSNMLAKAVGDINGKMQAAETAKTQVLTGETTNVHQAMIAVQESNVALSLMVEVRNKLVDSFQELMRMQV